VGSPPLALVRRATSTGGHGTGRFDLLIPQSLGRAAGSGTGITRRSHHGHSWSPASDKAIRAGDGTS
jgi:hypothetical protein